MATTEKGLDPGALLFDENAADDPHDAYRQLLNHALSPASNRSGLRPFTFQATKTCAGPCDIPMSSPRRMRSRSARSSPLSRYRSIRRCIPGTDACLILPLHPNGWPSSESDVRVLVGELLENLLTPARVSSTRISRRLFRQRSSCDSWDCRGVTCPCFCSGETT